ncbi:hypothetical protein GCM10022247_29650 [Allokutzneria multivorans]|uniref:Lipoprotein n=1 Tax=Allokutzneria multivorans TaxID=1142134 RepID=A0ABP7S314_9PSEU
MLWLVPACGFQPASVPAGGYPVGYGWASGLHRLGFQVGYGWLPAGERLELLALSSGVRLRFQVGDGWGFQVAPDVSSGGVRVGRGGSSVGVGLTWGPLRVP